MGLFDFLKKKKSDVLQCAECGSVINGQLHTMNGKTCCHACYLKKRPNDVRCSTCLRPIEGTPHMTEGKPYCRECNLKRMQIISQMGGKRSAPRADSKSDTPVPAAKKSIPHKEQPPFHLGTFSYQDADRLKIRNVAVRFLPKTLSSAETQQQIFKWLSAVMDITVPELKTQFAWHIPEGMEEAEKKKRVQVAMIETILAVNQTLPALNPDFLVTKATGASGEELLKAWLVLDYYAFTIKPEFTANIRHFRDYIHSLLLANEEVIDEILPVTVEGTAIYIDSKKLLKQIVKQAPRSMFDCTGTMALKEREPEIFLYEDGVKTRTYCLQTEGDENFTGKYFHFSIRLSIQGEPAVPVSQLDGFVADSSDQSKMGDHDVGYRMEVHFLACGGEEAKQRAEMNRGQDLPMKALKYVGYTTPSNVRLVGICPSCSKSFAFHGYAFYMMQSDVAYSDDGLDVCEIHEQNIDKDTWSYEADGKTFRYYNSFCCPHCGEAYIDYQKYPQNKVFGVSGCVHLGRKAYTPT